VRRRCGCFCWARRIRAEGLGNNAFGFSGIEPGGHRLAVGLTLVGEPLEGNPQAVQFEVVNQCCDAEELNAVVLARRIRGEQNRPMRTSYRAAAIGGVLGERSAWSEYVAGGLLLITVLNQTVKFGIVSSFWGV
jgi:hypothetical protein